jgi:CRP/FNR family transcriptional regulator, cyclic AMP receptor protein
LASTYKSRTGTAAIDKAALLSKHPLFRELGREVHERIAAYATTKHVARGETIFMKGDAGSSLFAVCSGTVEVLVPSAAGKNAVMNLINPGEIFGEIALLDGRPRTAETNKQLQLWSKDNIVRLERGGIVVLRAAALTQLAAE